ncbi:AMP-binding protein [Micromonospora sp. NPDC000663]|uniref:AMP-binding protein n=1 Tax=Micromonospora sp. NPDC000663 TaxID=3364218 RepID=UPI0036A99E74
MNCRRWTAKLRQSRHLSVAYVIFTSGSSGRPLGVLVEHRSLANYAQCCAAAVGDAGHGTPLFGSLWFDHSLTSLWPTLARGRRVVVAGGAWDQDTLFANRPPHLHQGDPLSPALLRAHRSPSYRDGMHLLMSGGEVLRRSALAGRRVAEARGRCRRRTAVAERWQRAPLRSVSGRALIPTRRGAARRRWRVHPRPRLVVFRSRWRRSRARARRCDDENECRPAKQDDPENRLVLVILLLHGLAGGSSAWWLCILRPHSQQS